MMYEQFFYFARQRHQIYIDRFQKKLPPPWTRDLILQQYRFTNIFRELDATTIWFRKNVRDELAASPDVMLATVLFRWFNRIETGEAIFKQELFGGKTTWDRRGALMTPGECEGWRRELLSTIRAYCGKGPYVTGAYIIKGTDGMDKLAGVLDAFYKFMVTVQPTTIVPMKVIAHWRQVAAVMLERRGRVTLEETWDWLRRYPYLGPFSAYEIVTDLRHTKLLDLAPDIMSWANPGPGAQRGLARVMGKFVSKTAERPSRLGSEGKIPRKEMLEEMAIIRNMANGIGYKNYWPDDWPRWEMREVEHTLCEFDKYERARLGQGRPRNTFKSAA